MDDFSRSLAAAALIDGQQFSLPGYGTLTGTYVSARINHAERHIEPPTLDLTWTSQVSNEVQTFEELLIATGATSWEAADIQSTWLDTLAAGEAIYLGDLGYLQLDTTSDVVGFTPHQTALDQAYWASGEVPLTPLSTRPVEQAAPVAPVVPIALSQNSPNAPEATVKPLRKLARRPWLVPFGVAASVLFGAFLIWAALSTRSTPDRDQERGQVVAVNQERLNRSPRELVEPEVINPVSEDEGFVAGGVADDTYEEEDFASAIPDADVPAFDPASLAGGPVDETGFEHVAIEAVIVLGSFGNQANAARMTEQVSAAGFLPYVDQQGELTRVGVLFEAKSEEEIADMMQTLRADFNPNAWLLE